MLDRIRTTCRTELSPGSFWTEQTLAEYLKQFSSQELLQRLCVNTRWRQNQQFLQTLYWLKENMEWLQLHTKAFYCNLEQITSSDVFHQTENKYLTCGGESELIHVQLNCQRFENRHLSLSSWNYINNILFFQKYLSLQIWTSVRFFQDLVQSKEKNKKIQVLQNTVTCSCSDKTFKNDLDCD